MNKRIIERRLKIKQARAIRKLQEASVLYHKAFNGENPVDNHNAANRILSRMVGVIVNPKRNGVDGWKNGHPVEQKTLDLNTENRKTKTVGYIAWGTTDKLTSVKLREYRTCIWYLGLTDGLRLISAIRISKKNFRKLSRHWKPGRQYKISLLNALKFGTVVAGQDCHFDRGTRIEDIIYS